MVYRGEEGQEVEDQRGGGTSLVSRTNHMGGLGGCSQGVGRLGSQSLKEPITGVSRLSPAKSVIITRVTRDQGETTVVTSITSEDGDT